MNEYQDQALKFLEKTRTKMTIEFLKHDKYFDDDFKRDIYQITMVRGARKYVFTFGQSVANSMKYNEPVYEGFLRGGTTKLKRQAPAEYDVLSCLQKYQVDTFEDFCAEFGYDTDSRKAYKTYEAVKNEYENLAMLFNDYEMEELQEIDY